MRKHAKKLPSNIPNNPRIFSANEHGNERIDKIL